MKIDFELLTQVSQKLHESYNTDSFEEGTHVYSIRFEPKEGTIVAHIQWPMFKTLAEVTANCPVEVTVIKGGPESLHLKCTIKGVELETCLFKFELVKMLEELHVETDLDSMSVLELLAKWQAITGWNYETTQA